MRTNQNAHPLLKDAEQKIYDLERKIDEDDYDSSNDGFHEEFEELMNNLREISEIIPVTADRDRIVLEGLIKRLKKIAEEEDLYN